MIFNANITKIEKKAAVDLSDATATAADIRSGKTAYGSSGKLVGTLTTTSTTDATATSADILSGKTAYVSSGKVSGSMTNRGAVSQTLSAGSSYTIPVGYHNGSGKVTASSLSSQTSATAAASDILSGKTAWVNGSKITGSMTSRTSSNTYLNAGESYTIPSGYHSGTGKVTANSLSGQTSGTATAADIASGKTAWVNGTKITGTNSSSNSSFDEASVTIYNNTPSSIYYYFMDKYGSGQHNRLDSKQTITLQTMGPYIFCSNNTPNYLIGQTTPGNSSPYIDFFSHEGACVIAIYYSGSYDILIRD